MKFSLKSNDLQGKASHAFGSLRLDNEFTDVTLASADGQHVEAHKVILAASSSFFQNMLRRKKHPYPLIYMAGIKSVDLVAILDFLYYGETNVYQENFSNFVKIAEELHLKGFIDWNDSNDMSNNVLAHKNHGLEVVNDELPKEIKEYFDNKVEDKIEDKIEDMVEYIVEDMVKDRVENQIEDKVEDNIDSIFIKPGKTFENEEEAMRSVQEWCQRTFCPLIKAWSKPASEKNGRKIRGQRVYRYLIFVADIYEKNMECVTLKLGHILSMNRNMYHHHLLTLDQEQTIKKMF